MGGGQSNFFRGRGVRPIMRGCRACSRSRTSPSRTTPAARACGATRDVTLDVERGRGRRPARRIGLRKVDAPPRHPRSPSLRGARGPRVDPAARPRAARAPSVRAAAGARGGDRDRVPGSRPRPQPRAARGRAGRGSGARPPCAEPPAMPRGRGGRAGRGRVRGARADLRRLSARAQRRATPASRPRAVAGLPPGLAPGRRADRLARLHDPGRDAGASRLAPGAPRARRPDGQPRPGRPVRAGTTRPRDVRGHAGRGGDARRRCSARPCIRTRVGSRAPIRGRPCAGTRGGGRSPSPVPLPITPSGPRDAPSSRAAAIGSRPARNVLRARPCPGPDGVCVASFMSEEPLRPHPRLDQALPAPRGRPVRARRRAGRSRPFHRARHRRGPGRAVRLGQIDAGALSRAAGGAHGRRDPLRRDRLSPLRRRRVCRAFRERVQLLFQDSAAALSPRLTATEIVVRAAGDPGPRRTRGAAPARAPPDGDGGPHVGRGGPPASRSQRRASASAWPSRARSRSSRGS